MSPFLPCVILRYQSAPSEITPGELTRVWNTASLVSSFDNQREVHASHPPTTDYGDLEMSKFVSWLLSVALGCLLGSTALAFDWNAFTPPPRTIPFIENGVLYDSFVQTRHPWFNRYYTIYYPVGIDENLKPVGTDYNQGPPYQHLRILLNPVSYDQAWDDYSYNPNVLVFGCTGIADQSACQNNAWSSRESTQIRWEQYTWSDWNYAGPEGYDLREDLMRSVGIDVKINFSYDWNGQFGLGLVLAGDVLIAGGPPPSYLSFPLTGLNAYTAKVSAVTDHSMTTPYTEDGIVRAFNGTEVKVENGRFDGCYRKADGNSFQELGINYVGTDITGNEFYLCYDGHPGYDYPYPKGTDINSPANGTLCVATTYTAQRTPPDVWRNKTVCGGIPSVVNQRWKDTGGHNVFYIFHREYINGSADDYMTVYLHNNNLSSAVLTSVQTNGYATVTRDQHVADVGKRGANGYHMHIEVFKKVGTDWIRVDPYGDGANNILWARDYTTNLR